MAHDELDELLAMLDRERAVIDHYTLEAMAMRAPTTFPRTTPRLTNRTLTNRACEAVARYRRRGSVSALHSEVDNQPLRAVFESLVPYKVHCTLYGTERHGCQAQDSAGDLLSNSERC